MTGLTPAFLQQSEDVSLWTSHRVMEWLRSADLAEYAPNLRGSGVHGAVLVSSSHVRVFQAFIFFFLQMRRMVGVRAQSLHL